MLILNDPSLSRNIIDPDIRALVELRFTQILRVNTMTTIGYRFLQITTKRVQQFTAEIRIHGKEEIDIVNEPHLILINWKAFRSWITSWKDL